MSKQELEELKDKILNPMTVIGLHIQLGTNTDEVTKKQIDKITDYIKQLKGE